MSGVVRAVLFAAVAVAAGSWVGLGRPDAEQSRVGLAKAWDDGVSRLNGAGATSARSVAPEAPPAPDVDGDVTTSPGMGPAAHTPTSTTSSVDRDRNTHPSDFEPLPQQRDPSAMPAKAPWPELNPDASIQRAWMVAEGPQRKPGDGRRLVTLTFDDGPFLETTPPVLKLLARYRVHATFFVVGRYLEKEDKRSRVTRELLQRIVEEGHLVGNHTLDHSLLTTISHTRVLDQIDRSAAAIERATGKYPYLFRPPYGALDTFGQKAARERHLDLMLWSVEAQDMTRDDTHQMFRDLVSQLDYKEGGVVLLHDIRFSSVAVLRELLGWLHEHRWDPNKPSKVGYEIVDLPTYLREVAAAPMPYASRDELERARREAQRGRSKKPRAEERLPVEEGEEGEDRDSVLGGGET